MGRTNRSAALEQTTGSLKLLWTGARWGPPAALRTALPRWGQTLITANRRHRYSTTRVGQITALLRLEPLAASGTAALGRTLQELPD